jgi:high-affinity iron transporter
MILGVIAPLLEKGEPTLLAELRSELSQLAALLKTYQLPDGTWTPVQSLTQAQREQLDGAIGNYLETVSPVPDVLEVPPEASSP